MEAVPFGWSSNACGDERDEGGKKIENPGRLYYNIIAMKEAETINNVHDKLFHQVFKNPVNTGEFLSIALPEPLLRRIDLSKLEIDDTRYVTKKFEDLFSDLVFKTKMSAKYYFFWPMSPKRRISTREN